MDRLFPKGEKDIEAGTQKLLFILHNKIPESEAHRIFMKSYQKCCVSLKFDTKHLKAHLKDYCIEHFNEEQIEKFHGYLGALYGANLFHGKTASD